MRNTIGPRQLTEDEARDTARRAYNKNTSLSSADIEKAIGRARRTVDSYIADLRAATQLNIDLKIFRMNRLDIPQDRIANRLGLIRTSLHHHLSKMPVLANSTNTNLFRCFTVSQVAEKQSVFHWGDKRFGDDWPARHRERSGEAGGSGRIPAQLIAHILFYFSKQDDLILDPMAGGGVSPDTCLALNRRCLAFDMTD